MSGFVPFSKRNRRNPNSNSLRPFNMIDDFFDETLGEIPFFKRGNFSAGFKVDVRETDKTYIVEAELPGVKKEDIDVKLSEDGELKITVQRSESNETSNDGENYIHRERRFESMRRTMYLNMAHPDGGMHAKLEHGVLTIQIEKGDQDPDESARTINIQ